jgi:hypothetical protein
VNARGCKHCHYLTFELGIVNEEKKSEAKDTGFNHPLHCSSSSKNTNGSNLDIVMW